MSIQTITLETQTIAHEVSSACNIYSTGHQRQSLVNSLVILRASVALYISHRILNEYWGIALHNLGRGQAIPEKSHFR